MNRFAFRACVLFLGLLASLPSATQEASGALRGPLTVSVADLVLERYVVQHVDENELAQTVSSLVGRNLFVKENGIGALPIFSLRQLGGTIVIYDTKEQAQRARALLESLDVPPPADAHYSRTLDYRPRFVSLDAALEAVIDLVDVKVSNERGVLTLSGSTGELEQAGAYLKSVDVPERQVLLSCLLLEVGAGKTDAGVPAELLENLRKLLPESQFSLAGRALLKTSVAARGEIAVQIESTGKRYRFGLAPQAFDEATGSLTVTNCSLVEEADSGPRVLFETSTVLRGGEYTVLAGTGATMRLLVVRILPQG